MLQNCSKKVQRFYMRADKKNMKGIRIHNSAEIPTNRHVYNSRFYDIPDNIILDIEKADFAFFPDIIDSYYTLVSETFMQVIFLYDVKVFFRRVVLIERESEAMLIYYLLYTGNLFLNAKNPDFKIIDKENGEIEFIASLDFVESLIRRGIKGIELEEMEDSYI